MATGSKARSSPNSIANDIKELMLTFLAGALLFMAFALLRDRARNAWQEGPASTVYGEF
jgi:hypothetical protein